MLKNNTFSASILEGFGNRFGRVFGRFFGLKMHAESPYAFSVQHQQYIAWAHEFRGSAFTTSNENREKIESERHVLGTRDFGDILKGFRGGVGKPKSTNFRIFARKNGSKN